MSDPALVAVYGTLKRGMGNHILLASSRFVGSDILTSIILYDFNEFPAAREEQSDGIYVEVFEAGDDTLSALDRLEGYDPDHPVTSLYQRSRCQTQFGEAWIYIYNQAVSGAERLSAGSWAPRVESTLDHFKY